MEEHPIQGLMTTAMESLKDMVEVNTIIGDPIESPDGSVIIPVSKVGFGFAAGGSEFVPSDSGSGTGSGEIVIVLVVKRYSLLAVVVVVVYRLHR